MPTTTVLRLTEGLEPTRVEPHDSEPMLVTVDKAKREYGAAVAYLLSLGDVKVTECKDGPISVCYELIKKPR